MQSILRYSLQLISAFVILLTLLSYVCPMVNPASFSWLAFIGTAFPWLLFLNILLLLFWAWRFNRFALYHLAIIVFGWAYVTGFIGFDLVGDNVPEDAITVCTHNLGNIYQGKKPTDAWRQDRISAYAGFLKQHAVPDILCTQETSGKFYRPLAEKLEYPYSFNLKKGTVILSKFPIQSGGDVPFGKTANSILWADIKVKGSKIIRVYNVHLQSNRVTQATERVLKKGELDEGETWQNIGSVLDKVGGATGIRALQAKKLREHIASSKYPVIVCGDFNDTPNSYVYSVLSEGLNDTFREKGFGFGTTFAGDLPFLRIDYILTEKIMVPYNCKVVKNPDYSDHYPVFSSIGL
ncbi:MAG: endonuclease/exonuclease/phosphatase family protein [Lewinellaceae bacterium]|nr:endonuclease/exonuclease/phosphatase family protein [Saprospiraceae bacterium]MCB9344960.1 endonuclease/exonuclease/phosphatase family protein [Lewinellaceae bacterium]